MEIYNFPVHVIAEFITLYKKESGLKQTLFWTILDWLWDDGVSKEGVVFSKNGSNNTSLLGRAHKAYFPTVQTSSPPTKCNLAEQHAELLSRWSWDWCLSESLLCLQLYVTYRASSSSSSSSLSPF